MTRTLIRTGIIALVAAGAALTGGAASAAPGDPLPGNPPLTLPAQPDSLYPLFSRCYDLEPAGNLPRRACYQFSSATGEMIEGSGQTFTYAPENTLTPPVIAAYTPRPPYVAPQEQPPIVPPLSAEEAAPRPAEPLPVVEIDHSEPAAGPTVTANGDPMANRDSDAAGCVPDAVRGMEGFDPNLDPDSDGVSCESPTTTVPQADDSTDGLVPMDMAIAYGLIAAASLVLLATIGLPLLRRAGRHRAAAE